ncbi:MAG: sigma-54-dependent transcriptional regulator [Thermoanaerobaculia bacterium]
MSAAVLVVDDEPSLLDFLRLLLESEGYEVDTRPSLAEARRHLAEHQPDLVLCDVMMPDGNGLELLEEIRRRPSPPSVIMMTAFTSTRSAIEAMKLGADDYLSKPFDVEELKVVLLKALEKHQLVDENVYLKRELEQRYGFESIVGRSRRMQEIFGVIERVARTNSTVLLEGESGTGKELIARALHYASPRRAERFLSVNCGALPETLLESELFGHKRGAFTGAVSDKRGLFQAADGGTLLLDEVGEMSPAMQVKLLRTLQDKRARAVGSNVEEAVDVRIIAATNRDLAQMVETGEFREDLYYRINVIPVRLPPLRQRREDIPLLVDHFLKKYAAEMGIPPKRLSVEALKILEAYHWPGNVRELENVIERALALSTGDALGADDIPTHLLRPGPGLAEIELPSDGLDLDAHLDDVRRDLMTQALERCAGVQTKAAELLGMSFRSFRYYGKKLGLTGEREEEAS